MSDIKDKVDSTIIHSCERSIYILEVSYQNSDGNTQEENNNSTLSKKTGANED